MIVPYKLFISGPGGVGKSGMIEPNDVIVLLTAFTGVAAVNVDGITLHQGRSNR